MLTQIKSAIALHLQPLSDRAKIIADDTDGEAGSKSQVRADYTIRIGYGSTTFTPPSTTETVGLQQGDRTFQISIEVKDFRNEDKTVQLLEDVENLLMGFHPCVKGVIGEIYLESDRFMKSDQGIYFYIVNVSVPCIIVKR
ncbi:Gp37 family protein [Nostoc sp.]|uniref:Gp37 family protein n=1 Tax=Nostoc sp. TaxID=1180 RepID=UPI002FF45587